MGVQMQPCCCEDEFILVTTFTNGTNPLGSQAASPCFLYDIRLNEGRMRNQRQIAWPSLGSEETLRDINSNAGAFGIAKKTDADLYYLIGDTGTSGPSVVNPSDRNEVATRMRLYTFDKKTGEAFHVGPFGAIGGTNFGTDFNTHKSLGSATGVAINPVQNSATKHIVSVNLTSGVATSLSSVSSAGTPNLFAFDFHPKTGELWGLKTNFSSNVLRFGKMTTTSQTFTEEITPQPDIIRGHRSAMRFDPDGNLYIVNGGGASGGGSVRPWRIYKFKELDNPTPKRVIDIKGYPSGALHSVSGLMLLHRH